jgi:hypothetical protein
MVSAWAESNEQQISAFIHTLFPGSGIRSTLPQTTSISASWEHILYAFVLVVAKDHLYFNTG